MRSIILTASVALASLSLILAGPVGTTSAPLLATGVYALPPAADWVEAASTGAPLAVEIGGEHLLLELRVNDALLLREAVRDEAGAVVDMRATVPLHGAVVGDAGSIVAATVFDGKVVGVIDALSVGPVVLAQGEAGPVAVTRAAGVSLPPGILAEPLGGEAGHHEEDEDGHDGFSCLQLTPHSVASATGLALGWPMRVFSVSVPVDAEFTAAWGSVWPSVATSWLNVVDIVYQRDLQLDLQVVDMHAHSAGVFTSRTTSGLLDDSIEHYDAAHSSMFRENVHLLTGKEPTNALGQANCIGGAGIQSIAYTMGQAANFEPIEFLGVTFYADGYIKIIAHEMGHILSGHHHYGNCVEAAPYVVPDRPDYCTLMFPFVDSMVLRFSSVNRLVERGWADSHNL